MGVVTSTLHGEILRQQAAREIRQLRAEVHQLRAVIRQLRAENTHLQQCNANKRMMYRRAAEAFTNFLAKSHVHFATPTTGGRGHPCPGGESLSAGAFFESHDSEVYFGA